MTKRLTLALGAYLAVVPGCGDDSTSGPDDGATDDAGADADADADGDADADADADGDEDGETPPDDGGGTGTLVVTVVGPRLCPDWVRHPIAGAAVAFDAPGGALTEATTDAAGRAAFEGIDWTAGTGAVTAWAEGYGLGSTLGLDGSDEEVGVILPVTDVSSDACVNLSGTALNMADVGHYLSVGDLNTPDFASVLGPDWTLQVPPGVPLTLIALESSPRLLATPQAYETTIAGWTMAEHAAVTADTTVELDFADAAAPTTVEGSCAMPSSADSPLRDLYLTISVVGAVDDLAGQTYPMSHGLVGIGTHGEPSADGSAINFGVQYLSPPGVTAPATNFTLWAWNATAESQSSAAYVRGYPAAGPQAFAFLDTARMVAPPDSTTHRPLHDPVQWTPPGTGLQPWVLLYRGVDPSLGVAWMLKAAPDATTLVVPDPPSAVPVATVLGMGSLRGYVRLVSETWTDDCFFRYSTGEYFILDLP
jgi:hypothetical protein